MYETYFILSDFELKVQYQTHLFFVSKGIETMLLVKYVLLSYLIITSLNTSDFSLYSSFSNYESSFLSTLS